MLKATGTNIDTCPTCESKLTYDEDGGFYDRTPGTYRFRGVDAECDCERQLELRQHYVWANIPQQYQRLAWAEYDGSQEARDLVATFLDKWEGFDKNGVGIELCGEGLGTGKTFAATTIGKELVKRNVPVYFIAFRDLIDSFAGRDDALLERVKSVRVLILDEVVPYNSAAQGSVYADRFESIIRHRTNWNLITIMTTNLEEGALKDHYPRVYSLLEAKQVRIVLKGDDQRMGRIGMENIELAANGEIRPLT